MRGAVARARAAGMSLALLIWNLTLFEWLVIACPIMFFTSFTRDLHLSAADLVLPFFLLAVLAHAGFRAHPPRRGSAVHPVAVFAVLAAVFTVASVLSALTTARGFDSYLGLSNVLKLAVGLTYAAAVATYVARATRAVIVHALRIWTVVAAVMSVLSVLTLLGVAHLMASDGFRSYGYFQDPNLYGGYLTLSLALVLVVETMSPSPATPVLIVAVSAGVVASASRAAAGVLGVLLVLAVLVPPSRRVRWTALPLLAAGTWVALAVLGVVGNWLHLPGIDRLHTSVTGHPADFRAQLWTRALHVWEHHPVFGIGIGQFGRYTTDIQGVSGRTHTGFIAHETFLSFLVELGLLGFLLAVGGILALAALVLRSRHLERQLRIGLLVGLLVMAAEMLTLNMQNIRYVWIFVGLLLGMCRPVVPSAAGPESQVRGRGAFGTVLRHHARASSAAELEP